MGKSPNAPFDRGFPVRRTCLAAVHAGLFAARLVLLAEGSFIFGDAIASEERAHASERSMVVRHRLFDSSILFRRNRRLHGADGTGLRLLRTSQGATKGIRAIQGR